TYRELVLDKEKCPYQTEEISSTDEDGNEIVKRIKHYKKKAIPQKTVIIKTGRSNKEQQKFLGYKFSNRRGYQGIDFKRKTLMFDRKNPLNPEKVNSYIRKNFLDEKIEVDDKVAENLSLVRLSDCINFERIDFDLRISLIPSRR